MREICMSGSTRERGAAVIDAIVFHSVLSSLLYRIKRCLLNPGGWRVGVVVPKTFQLRFVRRTVGDDEAVA